MPETPNPQQPAPGQQPYTPGHVPITEEFDKARWTLPPLVPVLIAAAIVAVIVAVIAFTNRSKPVMSGTIARVATADQDGNTMVAVQVKVDNVIDQQLWVKNVDAEIETADGKKYTDHAAPSSEVDRYLSAFPALLPAKADPLREELKIPPKTSFTGVAVFSYPVDQKTFDSRKSLTLRIQLYDQPTLVVKQ